MEINNENIDAVKAKDMQLQDVLANMKPGTVLKMIREGINPLTMSIDELQTILNGKNETIADTLEDYSHFLAKLDRKGGITAEERSAYIGVYRLLRQIEKGESAAVGSLINADMGFSLGNLQTALRSTRRQGMDYTVNDDFGGLKAIKTRDNLEVSLEKLREVMQAETDEEYINEQLKDIRTLHAMEDEIIRSLLDSKQPVTLNNLVAAAQLMKKPGELSKKADEYAKETELDTIFAKAKESLLDNFVDEEQATAAYEHLQKVMTDIFTQMAETEQATTLDVKELSSMCRQINLQAAMKTARITLGDETYREERYDIPVEIDGEITAVNLVLRHNTDTAGKVSCAMTSDTFGTVTAEFTVNDGTVTGHIAGNNPDGLKKLSAEADNLYTTLNEMLAVEIGADSHIPASAGTEFRRSIGHIHFIQSNAPDTNILNRSETKVATEDQNERMDAVKVSSKELYLVAKAFITFIQRMGNED
jgi:hypothetical protein